MNPHDALRELVQRYARAADARDLTALSTLFHPDAEINGARGSQTLAQWLETMRGPRVFPTSMHLIGEPLISLGDEENHASLDTYAVVYQISEPKAAADLTLGIRYLDEVVIHEGRWVIRRRCAQTLWMR